MTIERSLITGNSATDGGPACDGALATAGGNVIDSIAGCGITPAGSDTTGVLAPLGTLGAHAGPTRTMLPMAGNPAIDHIASCTGADQRGIARPQGPGCDGGAVELRRGLSASSTLALGSALVGQHSAAATTVVTNTGELDVAMTPATLGGPHAAEVEPVPDLEACTGGKVLAPGSTCKLKARLSPASPGAKSATYSVTIAGLVLDVPVTGTGDPRPARLTAPGPMALGAVLVGERSAAVTVVITNTGDLDADISGVSLSGPHAAEVEPVADPGECRDTTVLSAGQTCVLKARLAPTSAGAKTATYSVAMGAVVLDVPISGAGDPVPPASGPGGSGSSNTGGGPPAPPPTADAVLVGTSTKAGKLKLRLRCTAVGADRCSGSLTLKLATRKLTRAYSIAAGQEAFVTLKLGAGDRRRLARKRSLKSAVTVVTEQPDGTRRTTHQGSVKLLR